MNIRIQYGDHVRVNFNQAQMTLCSCAIVVGMPSQSGDFWIFKDADTGEVHYVSEPCTISLVNDKTITSPS